jgi:hypothetical protein
MLADQFLEAASAARNTHAIDEVARLTWRAHAEGQLEEAEAEAVSAALQARRAAFATRTAYPAPRPALGLPGAARRPPRSPDRQRSIERRRRTAASGAMPPALAANFTTGEQAALAVIGREVQRAGRCELYIDVIAAMAGVCRSVVQSATREAARLGLLRVTERRRRGAKSLTNVVEVIDQGWRAWLRIGFRKTNTTVTDFKNRSESARRSTAERESDAPSARTLCFRMSRPPR